MSTALVRTPSGLFFHCYPLDLVGRTLIGHSATWHPTGRPFWTLDTKPTLPEGGEDWVDTPHGSLWDWHLLGPLYDEAIGAGGLIVDVGANIGTEAVYAGAHGAMVLAVEAYRPNYELLCRNIAANGLEERVFPLLWVAYDKEARFKMKKEPTAIDYFEEMILGSVEFYRTDGDGQQGGPLDAIVTFYSLGKHIPLITTDVQGCDLAALRGLERTIREHHPVVLFECEEDSAAARGESKRDYLAFMERLGYTVEESKVLGNNFVGRPR